MTKNNLTKIILSIFICQLAGIIGSFFTAPAISEWYANLQKPGFAPPNWVFGPVWIILYTLMGISLYLIWTKGKEIKIPLLIFSSQLILNSLWSIIFFGLKAPFYAFVEITILWFLILLTIISFYKVSRKASLLLLPYILWVSIAALLNFFIWRLNL